MGVLSPTARLFLQHYLGHRTSLTLFEDKHGLLSLAECFCRKLTRVDISLPATHRLIISSIAKLITQNAHTLRELTGSAISNPLIISALRRCPHLQILHVQTSTRRSTETLGTVVAHCQELKRLHFSPGQMFNVSNVLNRAPPGLIELSVPSLLLFEMRVAAARFTQLQTLHVTTTEYLGDFAPALRRMTSLTDLSIFSGALRAFPDDVVVIRSFLQARGYHFADLPPMPEAERELEVIELPLLRKLKLDEGCSNMFVVQSEVLEEAWLTVFFEAGLALEMLRHSPALRKVYFDVAPTLGSTPGSHDQTVFVEACRRWPHLTSWQTAGFGYNGAMLEALAKHCRRLDTVRLSLRTCTVDSILALFALPDIKVVRLHTCGLEISEFQERKIEEPAELQESASQNQPSISLEEHKNKGGDKTTELNGCQPKLPPVIHSKVQLMCLTGKWLQHLIDRLQCPDLSSLSLHTFHDSPNLRFDSLLRSAAKSLIDLYCCNCYVPGMKATRFLESSFDWTLFGQLEAVQVPRQMGSDDVFSLVRDVPSLRELTVCLKSPNYLARLLEVSHPALLSLDVRAQEPWRDGGLNYLIPSMLLHPGRRPRALELLTIPLGSLSDAMQSRLPIECDYEMGDMTIDVKAYRP